MSDKLKDDMSSVTSQHHQNTKQGNQLRQKSFSEIQRFVEYLQGTANLTLNCHRSVRTPTRQAYKTKQCSSDLRLVSFNPLHPAGLLSSVGTETQATA